MNKNHTEKFFNQTQIIASQIDTDKIEKLCSELKKLRENNGRIFFLGVGGSAGHCSHAVNDFRKLCGIESYTPLDNVSELTARINDEGWDSALSAWLNVSNLNSNDAIFIMSVGGGSIEKKVSLNIVEAINYAIQTNSRIYGIVGPHGGYTSQKGDIVINIPNVDDNLITPHTEGFAAITWHSIVSNPIIQINKTKW
jgi:D-sedoheptulose 7-phosphate isomerase